MSSFTYQSALDKLGNRAKRSLCLHTTRNRAKRSLCLHTTLEKREDDAVAVKLYNTDIITWQKNGHIILNSGGYKTVTTADRLQSFLDYNIVNQWCLNDTWYVSDCTKNTYEWKDPIELDCHGKIIGHKTVLQETLAEIKAFRITKEKIVLKWTDVKHIWNRSLSLRSTAYGMRQLFKVRDNATIDAHLKTLYSLCRLMTARITEIIETLTLEQVSDLYDQVYDENLKSLIVKYCTGSFIPLIAMTEKKPKLAAIINERLTCYTKAA